MVIKIFALLMGLFAIILVILGTQDPYVLNFKSYNLNIKNIQADQITAYELNSTINSKFNALAWSRYQDKDVFYNFKAFYPDYNISSLTLSALNNTLQFQGNVHFVDANQTRIESQEIFYDLKDRNISSDVQVYMYKDANVIVGDKLHYDTKNKILDVIGVKAWLGE